MSEDLTAAQSLALGDSCLVDEDYDEALNAYTAALTLLGDSDLSSVTSFRALSHRAAANLQLERYQDALEDAVAAHTLLGTKVAGLRSGESEVCLRRQAVALFQLQHCDQALVVFRKAKQLADLNNSKKKSDSSTAKPFDYAEWIQRCQQQLDPATTTSAATSTKKEALPPAPAAAAVATATKKKTIAPPKYQYYQSDKFVTINICEARVKDSDLTVQFATDMISVKLVKEGQEFIVVGGNLYAEVIPEQCKINIKDEKVLVKLRKKEEGNEWYELLGKKKKKPAPSSSTEASTETAAAAAAAAAPTAEPAKIDTTAVPRPYASHRDWDSIEKEIAEEEEKEKPQGDDAMNKLFQSLYANADEDTKRAMVKSYQTSGGTVLSTNWNEVSKKDYEKERTAPKGKTDFYDCVVNCFA